MRGCEVSNLLIVESVNDKFFIEALLNAMNLKMNIDEVVCSIDDFECLGGIDKLEQKLKFIVNRVKKEGIEKIGIIFDADEIGVEKRTEQIKQKIDLVFGTQKAVEFSTYIINVDDRGELEDILKAIKTKHSPYADCLKEWRSCLATSEHDVSDKIFNKFWLNNYVMYDTCTSSKHRGKKDKYCIFKYAMKEKDIWDFEHPILNELKTFLKELGE